MCLYHCHCTLHQQHQKFSLELFQNVGSVSGFLDAAGVITPSDQSVHVVQEHSKSRSKVPNEENRYSTFALVEKIIQLVSIKLRRMVQGSSVACAILGYCISRK